MEQIVFPVPSICEFLTKESKLRIYYTTERDVVIVPQPGMEPVPPAMESWSPNHCTTRVRTSRLDLSQS